MPDLNLAVDIADAVAEVALSGESLDVEAKAQELLSAHPEADANRTEVVEAIWELAEELRVPRGTGPSFAGGEGPAAQAEQNSCPPWPGHRCGTWGFSCSTRNWKRPCPGGQGWRQ